MNHVINVINTIKKESPLLYWIVLFHLLIAIFCAFGVMIDDTALTGINVWIKPLKFAISVPIYIATVGYLITFYPYSPRKKSIINNIVAITLLFEIIIIVTQAIRGVKSHYNTQTQIDAILFSALGFFIAVNVLIMVLFIFDTVRLKLNTRKSIQWSILIGWIIVLFGSWIGGQMIGQMSHSVGVADGGPGLPLVNWSTTAGDLRVAHFFALHGIQLIPLFAFGISKKWKTMDRNRLLVVTVFGMLYAGWIGFTFYQAKQGVPFISE